MSQKFTQELRDRLKRYFQEYHGLSVSDDQADLFLDSLGGLFIAFNSLWGKGRQQARKRLRRPSPHSYT
jgi:hypothetical protein